MPLPMKQDHPESFTKDSKDRMAMRVLGQHCWEVGKGPDLQA